MASKMDERGLTLSQVAEFEEGIVQRVSKSRQSGIKGIAFTDPTFPADSSALPPSANAELLRGYEVNWARPQENFPSTESILVHGDAALSEFVQGDSPDGGFLSAAAALATQMPGAPLLNGVPNAAEALIMTPDEDVLDTGVLSARFWRDGRWQGSVVDTRIPLADLKAVREAAPADPMPDANPEHGELATPACDAVSLGGARGTPYAPALLRSRDAGEPWVPLLHKAYAALWAAPQPPMAPSTSAQQEFPPTEGGAGSRGTSRDRAASRRRARVRAGQQITQQLRALVHAGYRALHCSAPGAPALGPPWPPLSWSSPSASDVLADLTGCVAETWLLRGPHPLRLLRLELDAQKAAEKAESAAASGGAGGDGGLVDTGAESGAGVGAMRVTGTPVWAAWSAQRATSLWGLLQAGLAAGDRIMAVPGGPTGAPDGAWGVDEGGLGAVEQPGVAGALPQSPSAASLALSQGPVSPARGFSGQQGGDGAGPRRVPSSPAMRLALGGAGGLDGGGQATGTPASVSGSGGDGASHSGSRSQARSGTSGAGRSEAKQLPPSGAGPLGMELEGGLRVDAESGLLRRHGYPIVYAREVRRGVRLVKVRDPWPLQSEVAGAGWGGDWSDESETWAEQPEVESALRKDPDAEFERGQRGFFWMAWEDACRVFARLELVRNPRRGPSSGGRGKGGAGSAAGEGKEAGGSSSSKSARGPVELTGQFSRQAGAGRAHRSVPGSEADASLFRSPGGSLGGVVWRGAAAAGARPDKIAEKPATALNKSRTAGKKKSKNGAMGKASSLDRPPKRGKQKPVLEVAGISTGASPVPEQWMHLDGDSRFFLHPQYRLVSPPPPPPGVAPPPSRAVTLTLSQEDVRARAARVSAAVRAIDSQQAFPGTQPGSSQDVVNAWKDERWRRYLHAGITVVRRPRGARSLAFECGDQEVICCSEDAPFALGRMADGSENPQAMQELGLGAPRSVVLPHLHVDSKSSYILVVRPNETLPQVPQPRLASAASDAKEPDEALWWCPPETPGFSLRADEELDPTVQHVGSSSAAANATMNGPDAINALAQTLAKQKGAGRGDPAADGSRMPLRIARLPDPRETQVRGRWQVSTQTASGAPVLPNGRANPNWWMGPQWVVHFESQLPQIATATGGKAVESKTQEDLGGTFGLAQATPRGGRDTMKTGNAMTMTGGLGGDPALRTPEALAARPGSRTTLKLVLRRTDRGVGKDDLPDGTQNRIGIVLTRAEAVSAETDALKLRQARRTMQRGGGGLPLADTAAAEVLVRRAAGGGAAEEVGGTVVESSSPCVYTRRWGLPSDAWVWSTSFHSASEAVATVKVPSAWLDPGKGGGVCVHPLMRLAGTEGSYSLKIYTAHDAPGMSVVPVQEAAEPSRKQRHVSAWMGGMEPTAGGSHLHGTWTHNPGFRLVPGPRVQAELDRIAKEGQNGTGAALGGMDEEQHPIVRYSLVMRRPREAWRRAVTKDEAACMHGAYVVTVDSGRDSRECDGTDGLLHKASFMPAQESEATVAVPWGSVARAEKDLCVLCATFDPGQVGPFSIEVVSDEDPEARLEPYPSAVLPSKDDEEAGS